MELFKKIKQHFREELKEKLCLVDQEIAEPDVAPVIKPSPSPTKPSPSPTKPSPSRPKPERLPEEWEINKPKIKPTPKG